MFKLKSKKLLQLSVISFLRGKPNLSYNLNLVHYIFSSSVSTIKPVQIPLDYYRILGLPIQITDELLEQAYHDRCVQLPHQEYSQYAIAARKQLFNQAYEVLSNHETRKQYNTHFFQGNYAESTNLTSEIESKPEQESLREDYSPTIKINPELIIGALVILQELGEYELVLKLAEPYLDSRKSFSDFTENTAEIEALWHDLILTVVLTYIELAREQWQQGEYELAGNTQEKGHTLLVQEKLFPNLQQEIEADINKLKPYRILELLQKPETKIAERKKGLIFLKQMLDERQGIEGKGIDKSGLNVDDFLRFIQQIRVHLTAREQQELFEKEANRPSLAASYLAVYALIARGFEERNPDFIVRAKNILILLTYRQDVFLEQAICALLLGQTEEADFALAESGEEDTIKFIQEHSQGSPDLLPGLCLYIEKWLQTEVFPQFKDLHNQSTSLKEYFAEQKVQNYLEQLSLSSESTSYESIDYDDFNTEAKYLNWQESNENAEKYQQLNNHQEQEADLQLDQKSEPEKVNLDELAKENSEYTQLSTSSPEKKTQDYLNNDVLTLVDAERDSEKSLPKDLLNWKHFFPAAAAHISNDSSSAHQKSSESPRSHNHKQGKLNHNLTENDKLKVTEKVKSLFQLKKLLWVFLIIISGLLLLGIYNFIFNQKKTALPSLNLKISEPPVDISLESAQNFATLQQQRNLNNQTALPVIQNWLLAKSKATGPEYNLDEFNQVLTEPLLSYWRSNAVYLQKRNAYRRYQHSVVIESVKVNPNNSNQGIIIAKVKENSQYYQNGRLNSSKSYEDDLKIQYNLIKQNDSWLIKDIKVIKKY
jgi:hypothetical protein